MKNLFLAAALVMFSLSQSASASDFPSNFQCVDTNVADGSYVANFFGIGSVHGVELSVPTGETQSRRYEGECFRTSQPGKNLVQTCHVETSTDSGYKIIVANNKKTGRLSAFVRGWNMTGYTRTITLPCKNGS